jgi:hypothetical protein
MTCKKMVIATVLYCMLLSVKGSNEKKKLKASPREDQKINPKNMFVTNIKLLGLIFLPSSNNTS